MAVVQQSENALNQLKSHENEPVKKFIELDDADRPYRIYTTHFKAKDGDNCLVTLFEYTNPTSSVVIKRSEYVGTWVSATMNSADANVPDELKN